MASMSIQEKYLNKKRFHIATSLHEVVTTHQWQAGTHL